MRSLSVLAIVTCLIVVGCGRATNTPSHQFAARIEQVLAADKRISENVQTEVGAGVSRRLAIGHAVASMRAIDTSGCPVEFRTAYLRHCQAWRAAHQWLETQPESYLEVFVDGFFKGLTGEADLSDREAQQHQAAIRQTFEEVEVIAVRYGAKLP